MMLKTVCPASSLVKIEGLTFEGQYREGVVMICLFLSPFIQQFTDCDVFEPILLGKKSFY